MRKLLLIDANNMCFRTYFSGGRNLAHKGRSVNLVFGFFKQLISLHKRYPDYYRVVVWDGGYQRRLAESEEGVRRGLVPMVYKGQRERDNPELDNLFEQRDELRSALHLVRCTQVRTEGFEADDLIFTYANANSQKGGLSVIVSTDQDYYQVLDANTSIFEPMRKELWTQQRFLREFGFRPSLWVDAGAIMGEVGKSKDNIYGVDGWGPVNALKYVREFGSIHSIIGTLKEKKKLSKREQTFLDQIPRLRLAYSLKRMDLVPHPPKLKLSSIPTEAKIKDYFLEMGFASLLKEARRLA